MPIAARDSSVVRLTERDRRVLERWSKSRTLGSRVVLRSRIVQLLAAGRRVKDTARELGTTEVTVRLWRRRFVEHGPSGLLRDAPGRGRKPTHDETMLERLRADDTATVRELARALGVSPSTVGRWRARIRGRADT